MPQALQVLSNRNQKERNHDRCVYSGDKHAKVLPVGRKENGIYVSISKYGSDTPVTRPETDKAGLSSRDRKRGGGKLKCY